MLWLLFYRLFACAARLPLWSVTVGVHFFFVFHLVVAVKLEYTILPVESRDPNTERPTRCSTLMFVGILQV